MERSILAACAKSHETFKKINNLINQDTFSPEGEIIYGLISSFYSTDPSSHLCDLDVLLSQAKRQLTSEKHYDLISSELKALWSKEVISSENVVKELKALKAHNLGLQLASKCAAGKRDLSLAKAYLETLEAAGDDGEGPISEEEYNKVRAHDLVRAHFDKDNLIEIYPKSLNACIDGGAKGGHHVCIFAPTEGAKTLMAVNMDYGFLRQGLGVLYIGNEDPAADIIMRHMSRLTGMSKYDIQREPDRADALLEKRNWGLFTYVSLSPGTFPIIRGLIRKYQPKVLVLDQLSNLDVGNREGVQAKEEQAKEARKLAKEFNILVVSVTQAADSASNKRVLSIGDVYGSNVGIPSQMDLMIGVGSDEGMDNHNMKMLTLCKNKLSGNHASITVTIDPLTSTVYDHTQ